MGSVRCQKITYKQILVLRMCQGSSQQGAERDVEGIQVDRGVSINSSHELCFDGVCNIVGAYGKEAVGTGQGECVFVVVGHC